MVLLKIAVKDNRLIKVRDRLIIEDTINGVNCHFEFRSDWSALETTVVLARGHIYPATKDPQTITVSLDDNNECTVPPEIISERGEFSIGLIGENDKTRIVTNWLYFKANLGCYDAITSPNPPTPSEYDKILGALQNKSNINHKHDEYITDEKMTSALEGVKKYADDNDADTRYGIEYDSSTNKIKLTNDTSKNEVNIDDFVHEGLDGISVTHSWNGTVLTITSASGTSSVDLKGETGRPGADGRDGKDGADAVSPTVAVEEVEGGHRVTITDVGGNKTFDVLNGSDATSPSSIIDVLELPTENIDETAIYRLVTGQFIYNGEAYPFGRVKCVDQLPEIGDSFLNVEIATENIYYNITDGKLYGYVDEATTSQVDLAIGWYEVPYLYEFMPYQFGGIITDISEDPRDSVDRVLIRHEWYIYKNGWTRCVFAHEQPTIVNIYWDGETAGREMIKTAENKYFVKMSDVVPTKEDLIGATYCLNIGAGYYIAEDSFNDSLAGAIKVSEYILVINSAEDFMNTNAYSEGTPSNGIWFYYNSNNDFKVVNCVGLPKISKIPGEYLGVPEPAATKEGFKDAVAANGKVYYPSDGLSYSLRNDYTSYYLTGAKKCTDTHIVVPAKYKGGPIVEVVGSAFSNNKTMESITFHEYTNNIWSNAFSGCTALRSVYLYSKTPVTLGTNVFPTTVKKFFVPKDSVAAYKANSTWASYKAKIFPMEPFEDLTDEVNELKAALEALTSNIKAARIAEVTLLADVWAGEGNLYYQVVEIEGVTENSQVDLTPDVQQLAVFYEKDLAFVTENEDGVVTVYAIGQKPTNDYTIQVTITEVDI